MLQYPCTIRLRRAVGFLQGKPGWARVSSSEIWPAPSPNTVRFHRSASLRIRSRDNVAGSASMAIACACSAASIISSRMARSRRIERLRFGQHMVTHPTMNGSTGDEVYSPPKNFGQSLRKILDLPPQTHTRFQRKQEINVAIRASIPTRHGTENFKARDPVAFTQFAQTFLVHDLDRHAQSLDATQPIPASGSPSHTLSCGADIPPPRGSLALPSNASPTDQRQPSRQTPAFLSNASATAQAHNHKTSEPRATATDGGFYLVK